jgi:hypothetical protein
MKVCVFIFIGVTDQNVIHMLLNVKNIHALRQKFFYCTFVFFCNLYNGAASYSCPVLLNDWMVSIKRKGCGRKQ